MERARRRRGDYICSLTDPLERRLGRIRSRGTNPYERSAHRSCGPLDLRYVDARKVGARRVAAPNQPHGQHGRDEQPRDCETSKQRRRHLLETSGRDREVVAAVTIEATARDCRRATDTLRLHVLAVGRCDLVAEDVVFVRWPTRPVGHGVRTNRTATAGSRRVGQHGGYREPCRRHDDERRAWDSCVENATDESARWHERHAIVVAHWCQAVYSSAHGPVLDDPYERLSRALETKQLAGRLRAQGGDGWATLERILACERGAL